MPNRFQFGVTYYPEHWPAENHARDLDRIAAAGFNVVRLGEGAWWYWEPREGQYQFELFDRVIELCRERSIKVIMGTPTYCGPAWIASKYPEVLRANFDRIPMAHGSRRNYNYTSPKYLELSDRICTALATHYANEKQIVAWQLDNEFNCHMDVSYAPTDTIAFRVWLREKYGSIDALNHAWGTRFWSQVYDDWEQIDLPHPTSCYLNPTQLLDESRFISDYVVRFADRQAKIMRAASSHWQITHNAIFPNVNGRDLMKCLDFWSHDHYPLFWNHWAAFSQKLIEARSFSFPYAILEQQAGPGGQMQYLQRTPVPGEMRLWTYQSIAHGADRLLYFTWRTCPFGSEQHWHGLIEADGKDTARLAEASATAKEVRELPDDYLDAAPVKHVAVLRDFDVDINERRINTYTDGFRWGWGRWTDALVRSHIPTDFVWSDDDLSGYSVVIASHLKIVDDVLIEKLTKYVEAGGLLILGAQSGLHDRNLHIEQLTPPGKLAELAGVEVEVFSNIPKDQTRSFKLDGVVHAAGGVVEKLKLTTAQSLAYWTGDDPLLGNAPAIAANGRKAGRVIYIGAYLPLESTQAIVDAFANAGLLKPAIQAGDEIECVVRQGEEGRYITLLNHSNADAMVRRLPAKATAVQGSKPIDHSVRVPALGVSILRVAPDRIV